MSREEIIQGLQFTIDMFLTDPLTGEPITKPRNNMDKTTIDACKGAIELLQQESCEDAISRKEALEALKQEEPLVWCDGAEEIAAYNQWSSDVDTIKNIPPVQPKIKTGHWIESDNGNMISRHRWYCSECGGMHHDTETGEWREVFDFRYAYCPLCGARMIESQESEES